MLHQQSAATPNQRHCIRSHRIRFSYCGADRRLQARRRGGCHHRCSSRSHIVHNTEPHNRTEAARYHIQGRISSPVQETTSKDRDRDRREQIANPTAAKRMLKMPLGQREFVARGASFACFVTRGRSAHSTSLRAESSRRASSRERTLPESSSSRPRMISRNTRSSRSSTA